MKDNEKNLNNALSDEAVESIAGGFRWPWQSKWSENQKKVIENNFNVAAPEIMKKYNPKSFLKFMEKDGAYSQQEINQIKNALGL